MPTRSDIQAYATRVSQQYGVPSSLVLAVIETESSYRVDAVGRSGEIGLMQLMPATAASLGIDPYDWQSNIDGGISYLSQLFGKFGNWDMAIAAYNAGPGNVSKGIIPPSTKSYLDKVLSLFTGSTTEVIQSPTFSTTSYGLSTDLLFLLALAAGSAVYMITNRK